MNKLDKAAAQYAVALSLQQQRRNDLAAAVGEAVAAGMSESEAARRAGVTRMTIRAWLKP